MPTIPVIAGVVSSGRVLGAGDQLNVGLFHTSGGIAIDTTVNAAGVIVVQSGGVASATTVNSGGFEYVSAGGIASGSVLNSGGNQTLSSGGGTVATTVNNGGSAVVNTGAAANSITVNGGGRVFVVGGTASGGTVNSGGFLFVSSGGTTSNLTVSNGGVEFVFSANAAVATTVKAGGHLVVLPGANVTNVIDETGSGVVSTGVVGIDASSAVILYGPTISSVALTSGAADYVLAGGSAAATLVGGHAVEHVLSGGTVRSSTVASAGYEIVSSGGTASGVTVQSGGVLVLSAGAIVTGTSLNGGATLDISDLAYASGGSVSVDSGTDMLTVSVGGQSYTQQLTGLYTSASFHLDTDGSGGTLVVLDSVACFLRGVRILTPSGEVAVQDLRAGDLVTTLSGVTRPITWIGTGRTLVTPRNRCDVAPVIVRAGALSDGVPSRDLHLTRHHAMLVQGVLIPVEHLVNDISVVWDDQARVMEYFHIELDAHDILIADGAPAESFRDDNSATLFLNRASRPATADAMPPCAPIIESGEALEWAWTHIAARAVTNWAGAASELWTDDPDLHLMVDGRRIDAASVEGERVTFALPRAARSIAIASRTAIPAVTGKNTDLRRLGVALAGIVLHRGSVSDVLPLDDPRLSDGFTGFKDGHRWTKGMAQLPASFMPISDPACALELMVVGSLRYRAPLGGTAILKRSA